MLCRFYRDNKIAIDILFPTGLLHGTYHNLLRHHCRHHHHLSRQTTPRRPVASELHVISNRDVVHQRNRSDENAGGDFCSVCSLPGPDDHGSDRFVRGGRVLLHWPLLQPRLRSAASHGVFSGLQLFLQLLHLLQHDHPVPRDVTRHFQTVSAEE